VARRRLRASQRDQPRFVLTIEYPRDRRPDAWFTGERRVEAFLDQTLADPVHGGQTGVEGIDNTTVAPAVAGIGNVGFEQDSRTADHRRRAFALTNDVLQPRALLRGQPHDVLLHHDL